MSRNEPVGQAPVRGMALIAAMIVVVLAASAAVAMASRLLFDLRRLENTERSDQALLHAEGIEQWAVGFLKQAAVHGDAETSMDLDNARFNESVAGGEVTAKIVDLTGRFNLNNLLQDGQVSAMDLQRFKRLLAILEIDPSVAETIVDWIDPDMTPGEHGAEDDYYTRLDPPYRCANQFFASVQELQLVRGIDAGVYRQLRHFVTVLPARSDLNVNTASAELIRSLAENVSADAADVIIERRSTRNFDKVEDFLAMLPTDAQSTANFGLGVTGSFFAVRGRVTMDRARLFIDSMIERTRPTVARVLSRRFSEAGDG